LWIAAALAAFAWLAAVAFERGSGRSRRHRAVRALLLAVAGASLFLLAARPLHWRSVRSVEAVLLTSGAGARDLAAAAAAGPAVWAVPASPGEPPPPAGVAPLPDAAALARLHPEVARVRVAGHGLARWELAELALPIDAAEPPPLPFGIARVGWPRRLALGQALEVAGVAAGVPAAGSVLRLSGPAIGEASVRLAGGDRPFRLRVLPRGPGRHLLELRLEAAGRVQGRETLDVEVVAETPPALLWLDAAPSAEAREVKRWLASTGGALAWRAQISRGLARDEVLGTAPLPRGPLTAGLLRRFDLVVVDPRALAALGAGERAALGAAVREDGVGLLLRAGDAGAPAALGVSFPVRPLPGSGAATGGAATGELAARLDWPDGDSAPLPLAARELAALGPLVPFAVDRAGRTLAAWRPQGNGAVGASLVDDTWRWVLAGQAADHRRYWREAIATLARPAAPAARWDVSPGPLLAGLAATLTLSAPTPGAVPDAAVVRSPAGTALALPLRQDAYEPGRWSTTFWPREPGWHQVGEGEAAAWLWVAPAECWTSWRLAARQEATAARVAAPPPARGSASPARQRLPLPRWPLFALLLASLAVLWADEQLGGRPRP
jgi:hypothetical protein